MSQWSWTNLINWTNLGVTIIAAIAAVMASYLPWAYRKRDRLRQVEPGLRVHGLGTSDDYATPTLSNQGPGTARAVSVTLDGSPGGPFELGEVPVTSQIIGSLGFPLPRDAPIRTHRMDAYSGPSRPPVPVHAGRPFRGMPATHSGASRPPDGAKNDAG